VEIICQSTDFQINENTAVSIGKFDGVHVGHRKLLADILEAKKDGLASCVFTFDTDAAFFFGTDSKGELNTREEKRRLFEKMGIDYLVEFPLTKETAATEPEDFVQRYLKNQMHAKLIVAGEDLSFGARGRGNIRLLQSMADAMDFQVKTIEKVQMDGDVVASTRIRNLLKEGKIPRVNQMLGMPYSIYGTVLHGNQIGRTIGFPTVNIQPDADKLMPPFGVYMSKVLLEGKTYPGITNIGVKPTVEEKKIVGVETFLYNFEENVYGKDICVQLYEFTRPETNFHGLEQLKAQLERDISEGALYWGC